MLLMVSASSLLSAITAYRFGPLPQDFISNALLIIGLKFKNKIEKIKQQYTEYVCIQLEKDLNQILEVTMTLAK